VFAIFTSKTLPFAIPTDLVMNLDTPNVVGLFVKSGFVNIVITTVPKS
jgi:hypothetical protein